MRCVYGGGEGTHSWVRGGVEEHGVLGINLIWRGRVSFKVRNGRRKEDAEREGGRGADGWHCVWTYIEEEDKRFG